MGVEIPPGGMQREARSGLQMAGETEKLTALAIKAAGAGKHFDGGGMFLHITTKGRYWRLKYRVAGKEKLLALGVYPEVSLAEA